MAWPKLFSIAASGIQEDCLSKYDIDLYKKSSLLSTSLHFAVIGGNAETISYIINSGVNINSRNLYGETPLLWCCKEGNLEIAKVLVEHGAKINIRDGEGNTPLHWAAEYNQHEMVSYFLSKGTSLNRNNDLQQTPIDIAIENQSLETVAIFTSYLSKESVHLQPKKPLFLSTFKD